MLKTQFGTIDVEKMVLNPQLGSSYQLDFSYHKNILHHLHLPVTTGYHHLSLIVYVETSKETFSYLQFQH